MLHLEFLMVDLLHRLLIRFALAMLAFGLLPSGADAEARRVAVVVSNANYASLPKLDSAQLDGQAMAAALAGLGFEVSALSDPDTAAFQAALANAVLGLGAGDTALFYYAGHVIRQDGMDLLVPVAASLTDPDTTLAETWALQDVVDAMKVNDVTLVMLLDGTHKDALADDLLAPQDGEGAAHLRGGANSFVALAEAPGTVDWSKQEAGSFSPFTAALLANIGTKGLTLTDVMAKIRAEVLGATGSDQIPWMQSSLRQPFYFTAPDTSAGAAVPAFALAEAEVTLISAPAGAGRAAFAQMARLPENLPRAVQEELKRVGCYGNAVDGDWGRGSRAAMEAYYAGKKIDVGEEEPTEQVYRTLLAETDTVCIVEAVAPKPAESKPSGTKKPASTKPAASKPATSKPATAKPAAKKPAAAAPAAKKPVCKFYGVAVICK